MTTGRFTSVDQVREALKCSGARPTFRAEFFEVARRYEAECNQRASEQATYNLQAPAGQKWTNQTKLEWRVDVAAVQISLPCLFDYSKIMGANESAANFESGWPLIDLLSSIEQLEAVGGEVLLDVVATPGRGLAKGVCGIANIVVDLDSIAGRFVYAEVERLQNYLSRRQAWGEEFDERRSTPKRVRREHFIDWLKRVPAPNYQPPDRNAFLQGVSLGNKSREPKRSGHLAQALSGWLEFWNFNQGHKVA